MYVGVRTFPQPLSLYGGKWAWPIFVKVRRSHDAASIRTWQIFVSMPVLPATLTPIPFSQQADILNRRNTKGHLMFPHLQTALTTRWGRYAWEKPSYFCLDNHLVVSSPLFRGRIINDWNIQVRGYSRCLWGQDRTGQVSTPHHSTPHYSTAHYSTAQHTTAQHTTAHHTTAHYTKAHHTTPLHTTAHHTTVLHTPTGCYTVKCEVSQWEGPGSDPDSACSSCAKYSDTVLHFHFH
jgi:hypothetical protein